MTHLTTDEIVPRLIAELNYSPRAADMTARRLVAADAGVQAAFYHWWTTGELAELEAEGYTVARLIREHSLNPIAAYLTIDWLLREPKAALALLAKGYDRVVR